MTSASVPNLSAHESTTASAANSTEPVSNRPVSPDGLLVGSRVRVDNGFHSRTGTVLARPPGRGGAMPIVGPLVRFDDGSVEEVWPLFVTLLSTPNETIRRQMNRSQALARGPRPQAN